MPSINLIWIKFFPHQIVSYTCLEGLLKKGKGSLRQSVYTQLHSAAHCFSGIVNIILVLLMEWSVCDS